MPLAKAQPQAQPKRGQAKGSVGWLHQEMTALGMADLEASVRPDQKRVISRRAAQSSVSCCSSAFSQLSTVLSQMQWKEVEGEK